MLFAFRLHLQLCRSADEQAPSEKVSLILRKSNKLHGASTTLFGSL